MKSKPSYSAEMFQTLESRVLLSSVPSADLSLDSSSAASTASLSPQAVSPANIKLSTTRLIFGDPRGGGPSEGRSVTISNVGGEDLTISSITLTGSSPGKFTIVSGPTTPVTLSTKQSVKVTVAFDPAGGDSLGVSAAYLTIASDDTDSPLSNVRLRGLATNGTDGANEPSLQRILDLYEIGSNVGDDDPATSDVNFPFDTPNDQVSGQRFIKAGDGPVQIYSLAVYGAHSDPAVQFGYYDPGTPSSTKVLFDTDSNDFQSVAITTRGATQFDPGSSQFGLSAAFPGFTEADSTLRTVYSEDALNFFETDSTRLHHVVVMPYKDKAGNVLQNYYVVAFEEAVSGGDFQDYVAVLRNVTLAPSGPEIGLTNLDNLPYSDRLVFNKIRTPNVNIPNSTHTTAKVRVRNTGSSPLHISSMTTSGPFKITNPTSTAMTVAAGGYLDVTVQFTATTAGTNDGYYTGTLTINSDDSDEAAKPVQLAGFWQKESENQQEPSLAQLTSLFGYSTVISYSDQILSNGGKVETVGDEILAPYWTRVNPNIPVTVRELATFHTQGETATLSWFKQGSSSSTAIFTHKGVDGQSLLPRSNDGSTATKTFTPAASTSQVFGFKIEQVVSDPTKNPQEQPGGGYGHAIRFFPIRDRDGFYVQNTFLMVMDYPGVNYDYNDNVYIVSNVKPTTFAAPPENLAAYGNIQGVTLDWADARSADNIAGYYVYRSYKPTSGFVRFKTPVITASAYRDTTAEIGKKAYYRVIAVGDDGSLSFPITTSFTRMI